MLLKFAGCLGTHAQSQSSLADGGAVEVGGFKDHHGGVVPDFAVQSAHDACQADGLILIGNDQHTGLQGPLGALQGGHGLALPGFPNHDLAGGDIAVVKGVHRLAVFQHDIIGNVHDVVDGPDAVGTQTLPHPLGRGADLHVGDHPGGVAVAQILCLYFHIQVVEDGACLRAVDHGLVVAHMLAKGGGSFPGQADDGVAIGPVVGDLEVNDGVVIADNQVNVIAGLSGVGLQDPDAVGEDAGQIVLGQAQFREGAEHTVGHLAPEFALGDVYAAGQIRVVQGGGHQVALVDVLGAGDDLHGLGLAYVHLADEHMVRVGVADDGHDLAHHHILDFRIHALPGLYLLAEDRQRFHKFLIGDLVQIHELLIDPFSVQFHFLSLLRTGSGTGRRCRRSDAGR